MTALRDDLMNIDPYDPSRLTRRVIMTDELICSASLLPGTLLRCNATLLSSTSHSFYGLYLIPPPRIESCGGPANDY